MYKENLLKAEMVKQNLTISKMANLLDLSSTGFWNKLNGRNDFTTNEVSKISELLSLNIEQREAIFFANDVQEN